MSHPARRGGVGHGTESFMAHSPHKNWKGCRVCKPHKMRGRGRAFRDPWPVLRKLGMKRRVTRNDLGR